MSALASSVVSSAPGRRSAARRLIVAVGIAAAVVGVVAFAPRPAAGPAAPKVAPAEMPVDFAAAPAAAAELPVVDWMAQSALHG